MNSNAHILQPTFHTIINLSPYLIGARRYALHHPINDTVISI